MRSSLVIGVALCTVCGCGPASDEDGATTALKPYHSTSRSWLCVGASSDIDDTGEPERWPLTQDETWVLDTVLDATGTPPVSFERCLDRPHDVIAAYRAENGAEVWIALHARADGARVLDDDSLDGLEGAVLSLRTSSEWITLSSLTLKHDGALLLAQQSQGEPVDGASLPLVDGLSIALGGPSDVPTAAECTIETPLMLHVTADNVVVPVDSGETQSVVVDDVRYAVTNLGSAHAGQRRGRCADNYVGNRTNWIVLAEDASAHPAMARHDR